MGLFKMFGKAIAPLKSSTDDLGLLFSEVSQKTDISDEQEIKKIAGYAGLLGKIAAADMHISDEEIAEIRRQLSRTLKLTESQVASISHLILNNRVQLFSVEDHVYARLINDVCGFEEKRLILTALFSLAAADGAIRQEEDAAIWTVAKSLQLTHKDFISARKQFIDFLDILKT